jgi:hypothetical protein
VVGSLLAGIVNSGITAAWMLIYLISQPQWMARARKEIKDMAAKYSTNPEASLIDQLDSLPLEIWETKFPFLDMWLKDTIRLQLPAALLRKNISSYEIGIGDEILPNGAIAVCFPINLLSRQFNSNARCITFRIFIITHQYIQILSIGIHHGISQKDKEEAYGFRGWGAGRHPYRKYL